MKPGIHAGLSFTDYQAIDAVNNSKLRHFRRTPAHAHYALTHPEEDTEALRTGEATHAAILEPKRFEERFVRAPKFDKRSNAGKAQAAAWLAQHPRQFPLLPEEWDEAVAMRDAAWSHPLAAELLKGSGQNEITAIWKDAESGLLCKARMDRFTAYQGWSIVLDIKTTREDATPNDFGRACARYGYHQQAAFYLDGLNVLSPRKRRFVHLVIEKAPPYCCCLFELDESAIAEGRALYRRAFTTYAECEKAQAWPGYPPGIYGMDLPPWGYELTSPPR